MTFSHSASTPPTRPVVRRYAGLDPAVALARRQGGVITFRQAMSAGLTRGQLRQLVQSDQWSHPVRGAFVVPVAPLWEDVAGPGDERPCSGWVPQPVPGGAVPGVFAPPPFPLSARVRAALVGRPHAVVCNITAARLLGLSGAEPESPAEPVHLLLPPRLTRAQPRGIRLHFTELGAGEQIDVAGIPVTSPARTVADLVLAAPNREAAVTEMDAALRSGVVRNLRAAREAAAGRRGFRQTQGWWDLADGRAESALETRLRLLLADAGLAPPQLQWPVQDGGQSIAKLDLAWPEHRLDVEADTATAASSAEVFHLERLRGNLLAARRWAVLRFSELDVAWYPERIVAAVDRFLDSPAAWDLEQRRAS
ncbi:MULTISPECIES: type IV toxin-antitoxin system AbiEi family antitoxin domain-containing protein [Frankia]|nr:MULTISPECIES: type IV toxin-antitoxin system AbiEi family antitoxin domain-containing protein [Frankia]